MIERGVTISAGIESLTKKGKFRMSYCMGKGEGGRGVLSLTHIALQEHVHHFLFCLWCIHFTWQMAPP